LKDYFTTKRIDIALVGTFGLFFVGCLLTIVPISLLISSQKKFTIIK
jgi:hypothetical protein